MWSIYKEDGREKETSWDEEDKAYKWRCAISEIRNKWIGNF